MTSDETTSHFSAAAHAQANLTAPILRPVISGLDISSLEAERQIEPRISRMERERRVARRSGVWGLLRLHWQAWLEERMQGPPSARYTRCGHLLPPPNTPQGVRRFDAGQFPPAPLN